MTALKFLKEQRRRHINMAETMKVAYFDDELDETIEELEALQSKFNRVEVISSSGRVFCDKCDSGRHYELSIQDDNRTLKIFEVKDKQ